MAVACNLSGGDKKMRKMIIAGIIAFVMIASAGLVSASNINVDFDVGSGFLDVTTNGFDHTTWHPGTIGETNTFTASGGFHGNYNVNEGSYGTLNSFINADAYSGGADFIMTDYQDFNVMSGNHEYNVEGYFMTHASGNDDQVAMNLKSVGSMYVWSEATNPYQGPALRGGLIEKEVWTNQDSVPKTDLYLGVNTDGIATMYNSNIWGWSNGEHGTSTTNYGGGTRDVSATGSGTYMQSAYGANGFNFNGFSSPGGGSMTMNGAFGDGFNFQYSMDAN